MHMYNRNPHEQAWAGWSRSGSCGSKETLSSAFPPKWATSLPSRSRAPRIFSILEYKAKDTPIS